MQGGDHRLPEACTLGRTTEPEIGPIAPQLGVLSKVAEALCLLGTMSSDTRAVGKPNMSKADLRLLLNLGSAVNNIDRPIVLSSPGIWTGRSHPGGRTIQHITGHQQCLGK